jgi:CubicO group peptidase (beta-lactamase class C family)
VSSERAAGSSCCDTLYADTPLVLNESAAFFSLLPQFCLLMDKGKFKATSFLGEVLKIKDPVQSRILLSDLATHHSGLPATGKDFSYNMKNAGGLAVNMQKNLIYSNVNLFYIRQIVLKYIAQYELSDDISNLFDGLGMHSTKLLPPSENSGYRLKTTLKDMSIFFQALYNGGTYGGFRFMSRSSAAFMCMIATYYSHDSSGLSFSLNPQTESVDYFLRNMNSPRLKIK